MLETAEAYLPYGIFAFWFSYLADIHFRTPNTPRISIDIPKGKQTNCDQVFSLSVEARSDLLRDPLC